MSRFFLSTFSPSFGNLLSQRLDSSGLHNTVDEDGMWVVVVFVEGGGGCYIFGWKGDGRSKKKSIEIA